MSIAGLLTLRGDAMMAVDSGTRASTIGTIQRLAGNRSAARFIEWSSAMSRLPPGGLHRLTVGRMTSLGGPVLQRQAQGGATAAPVSGTGVQSGDLAGERPSLANARFVSIPRLQAIAKGEAVLSQRDPRPAVRAIQQALLDVGYSLLRYHTDGQLGTESSEAIQQFRIDRQLAAEGGLDAAALIQLDRLAPPPGASLEHYVDYDRLFADNQFDVTLALGYDEPGKRAAGNHEKNIKDAHEWLEAQHFERVTAGSGGGALGPTELWRSVRKITYPTKTGERVEKEITINFRLITPGAGAAAAYGEALNQSELTIYAGHARRGVGPDFDADKTPSENFVIGVHKALQVAGRKVPIEAVKNDHYVIDQVNDLQQMKDEGKFDKERYRIWFFNACSTVAYLDHIRGGLLPTDINRSNLDIFGTTTPPATFQVLSKTSLTLLEGILSVETMEGILRRMDDVGLQAMRAMGFEDRTIRKMFHAMPYFREGAGDNQVATPAR